MLINKIRIKNHKILGDLDVNFEDYQNIILIGENGTGKTTFLKMLNGVNADGECDFSIDVVLSESELSKLLVDSIASSNALEDGLEYPIINKGRIISEINSFKSKNKNDLDALKLKLILVGNVWKVIFNSSNESYPTNFNPLLLNIQSNQIFNFIQNANCPPSGYNASNVKEILSSANESSGKKLMQFFQDKSRYPTSGEIIEDTKKFINAFASIFEDLDFSADDREIKFSKNGVEIPLDGLSSGEKQIIIRATTIIDELGKDKSIVLIDEPELNLHPLWQRNILDFYKKLMDNSGNEKKNQLIIATHSLEILNSVNYATDKVLIFKRAKNGKIVIEEANKNNFNSYSQAAFNCIMSNLIEKTNILVEGPTDVEYLRKTIRAFDLSSEGFMISQIRDVNSNKKDQGGYSHMDTFYKWLKNNDINRSKTVFLYDHDVKQEDSVDGNLYKLSFDAKDANNYFPSSKFGIESLLILDGTFNISDMRDKGGNIRKKWMSHYVNSLSDREAKKVLANIVPIFERIKALVNMKEIFDNNKKDNAHNSKDKISNDEKSNAHNPNNKASTASKKSRSRNSNNKKTPSPKKSSDKNLNNNKISKSKKSKDSSSKNKAPVNNKKSKGHNSNNKNLTNSKKVDSRNHKGNAKKSNEANLNVGAKSDASNNDTPRPTNIIPYDTRINVKFSNTDNVSKPNNRAATNDVKSDVPRPTTIVSNDTRTKANTPNFSVIPNKPKSNIFNPNDYIVSNNVNSNIPRPTTIVNNESKDKARVPNFSIVPNTSNHINSNSDIPRPTSIVNNDFKNKTQNLDSDNHLDSQNSFSKKNDSDN